MKLRNFRDALIYELRDLYSAETQLIRSLPKMARAARDETLADAFTLHLEETRNHVARLDDIFKKLAVSSRGEKCRAIEGLIEDGESLIGGVATESVRDAVLISAAQRVEHYEMTGYGTARTLANTVGETDVADLLQQTLDEEFETDLKLTSIAQTILAGHRSGRQARFESQSPIRFLRRMENARPAFFAPVRGPQNTQ